jgi:hypothetical protein
VYSRSTLTALLSTVWLSESVTVHFQVLIRELLTGPTLALKVVVALLGELADVDVSPLTRDHA